MPPEAERRPPLLTQTAMRSRGSPWKGRFRERFDARDGLCITGQGDVIKLRVRDASQ